MKKAGKRIAAWLTALALCAGMLPAVAFAEETPAGTGAPASVAESENTSALAATPGEAPVTAAAQSAPAPAAPRVAEGDDLVWDEATKTLTYTGTSFEADLSGLPYEKEIETLVLDNSEMVVYEDSEKTYTNTTVKKLVVNHAKSLGDYAFSDFTGIETVELRNIETVGASFRGGHVKKATVEDVGTLGPQTFYNTNQVNALQELSISRVQTVNNAFGGTKQLKTVTISDVDTIYEINTAQTMILKNIGSIEGQNASLLANSVTEELIIENVGNIGELAFFGSTSLKSVKITSNLETGYEIGYQAFYTCVALESVELQGCTYVSHGAFDNCPSLKSFTCSEETKLGYSDSFAQVPGLADRMEAIMADQFVMGTVEADETLVVPDGWESSHTGAQNTTDVPGTQVTKAARWGNADETEAEVQLQFSYTETPGRDFLFVLDYSLSMKEIGNPEVNDDSKFSDMQSKMLDVVHKLLTAEGFNNRVGFVTFSDKIKGTLDFTDDWETAEDFIRTDADDVNNTNKNPLGETNYSIALQEALGMVSSAENPPVVIFVSDGMPNRGFNGSASTSSLIEEYTPIAQSIRDAGAQTLGVIQGLPVDDAQTVERCESAIAAVCGEGNYFLSNDTEGFGRAVNDALGVAFGRYTLTDVVNADFLYVPGSHTITADGQDVTQDFAVTYDEATRTLTWDTTGAMPYTDYVLTFRQTLVPNADGSYPEGYLDTNEGDAVLSDSAGQANAVATPTLLRGTVLVQPADITIYMGGSEGYEGVVNGSDGTLGKTDNSLPEPGFYVTLPDVVNELLQAETGVAGAADLSQYMTVRTASGDRVWTLEQYGATNSVAYDKFIYRIVAGDGQDPVRLEFKDEAGNLYISDSFEPSEAGALTQEYTMGIYAGAVDLGNVVVDITVGGKTYTLPVRTETGTLDVRYVTGEQADVVTGVVSDIAAAAREDGKAYAEMPADTVYTINASDVDVTAEAAPSLLFDDVVSTANTAGAQDNATLVRTYALETLADVGLVNPQYEAKYLDLVDANNGNAWLTASNPVKVYWPYPDGTGEDTQFYLVHFEGLHRDMNNGDVEALVAAATKTRMQVTNTEYGISFETDGFSPFVLVWDAPKTTTPVTPGTSTGTTTTPQTGDASHAALWAGLLALGALGVAGTGIAMSRSKRRKAR